MPRNYGAATPSYVTMLMGAETIKYGYKCRLEKQANYLELGITKIETVTEALLQKFVIGANAPKPPRATRRESSDVHGYESSFISHDKIVSAKALRWKITKGKLSRRPSATALSSTRYVTVNGIKYAWQSAKTPAGLTVAVDGLQVKTPTANEDGLIWGANFPVPPQAETDVLTQSTYRTFYDPDLPGLPDGWVQSKMSGKRKPRWTLQDLQAYL